MKVPSVFHSLMQIHKGIQIIEESAIIHPMP